MTKNKTSKINETNIKMYAGTKIREYLIEALQNVSKHPLMNDMYVTDYSSLVIVMEHPDTFMFTMTNDIQAETLDLDNDPIGFLSNLAYKSTLVIEAGRIIHELFIEDTVFRGEITLKEAFDSLRYTKFKVLDTDDGLTRLVKETINAAQIDLVPIIQHLNPIDSQELENLCVSLRKGENTMTYKQFCSWMYHLGAKATITVERGGNTISLNERTINTSNIGTATFKKLTGGGIEPGKVHLFVVEKDVYAKFAHWLGDYVLMNQPNDNIKITVVENDSDIEDIVYNNRNNGNQTDVLIRVIDKANSSINHHNTSWFNAYSIVYNAYLIAATDSPAYVGLEYIKTRQDIRHGLRKPFRIRISSN